MDTSRVFHKTPHNGNNQSNAFFLYGSLLLEMTSVYFAALIIKNYASGFSGLRQRFGNRAEREEGRRLAGNFSGWKEALALRLWQAEHEKREGKTDEKASLDAFSSPPAEIQQGEHGLAVNAVALRIPLQPCGGRNGMVSGRHGMVVVSNKDLFPKRTVLLSCSH